MLVGLQELYMKIENTNESVKIEKEWMRTIARPASSSLSLQELCFILCRVFFPNDLDTIAGAVLVDQYSKVPESDSIPK